MNVLESNDYCQNGWAIFDTKADKTLAVIATSFGAIVPPYPGSSTTRRLQPGKSGKAQTRSLSSIYGTAAYPLHSDCAYYRRPPDVILFRARTPSRVATVLLDAFEVIEGISQELLEAPFVVRGIRKSFLSPILRNGKIRWDTHCMSPAEPMAAFAAESFLQSTVSADKIRHEYIDSTTTLVINNRRMLHGRESATNQQDRMIESVLIYKDTI